MSDPTSATVTPLFPTGPGGPGGPSGPSGTDYEKRITALETKLDVVLPSLASKLDIAELKTVLAQSETKMAEGQSSQLRWFVGWVTVIGTALVSAAYLIAKYIH